MKAVNCQGYRDGDAVIVEDEAGVGAGDFAARHGGDGVGGAKIVSGCDGI